MPKNTAFYPTVVLPPKIDVAPRPQKLINSKKNKCTPKKSFSPILGFQCQVFFILVIVPCMLRILGTGPVSYGLICVHIHINI